MSHGWLSGVDGSIRDRREMKAGTYRWIAPIVLLVVVAAGAVTSPGRSGVLFRASFDKGVPEVGQISNFSLVGGLSMEPDLVDGGYFLLYDNAIGAVGSSL